HAHSVTSAIAASVRAANISITVFLTEFFIRRVLPLFRNINGRKQILYKSGAYIQTMGKEVYNAT
ncbi:MAG: hypothetical protein K2J16_05460, partial [Clostridia bacterium]|nr:hypothetical protein [Clostridia bacterium]